MKNIKLFLNKQFKRAINIIKEFWVEDYFKPLNSFDDNMPKIFLYFMGLIIGIFMILATCFIICLMPVFLMLDDKPKKS